MLCMEGSYTTRNLCLLDYWNVLASHEMMLLDLLNMENGLYERWGKDFEFLYK